MNQLSQAIIIATMAHNGQVDKAGEPYILHPIRVMCGMSTDEERIVAVLHDVVEDNPQNWPLERLSSEGFSATVIEAIAALTKVQGENYTEYIQRVSQNELASIVKLNDLEDNMNTERIPNPTSADDKRYLKYRAAYDTIWRKYA
jgi:(p)ppGpp synthase/HD superfamily hydrolase